MGFGQFFARLIKSNPPQNFSMGLFEIMLKMRLGKD